MTKKASPEDIALIDRLGGPAKLAELLGLQKDGGVQRVNNWRARGIPAEVKLEFPHVFLAGMSVPKQEPAGQEEQGA